MNLDRLEMLVQGSSKKLYATNRPSYAILEFTDEAGNPRESRKTSFAGKGEINCGVSSFLFQYLENYHVPTHFVERQSPVEMAVRRVDMFDIKAIVYNVATGEFARRFRLDDGRPLDYPVVEYFLKDPALNNPMVNESHAVALGYARSDDLRTMQRIATKTNAVLKSLFERRGLLLVEFELEFGDAGDHLCIGDELTADTLRVWDRKTNRKLDRDRALQDQSGVERAYRELLERLTSAA